MAPRKGQPNSSAPDSMQLRQWEFWETLRRHHEYKKLCEGIEFLDTGTINPTWGAAAENQQLITERRRRIKAIFGVEGIMDPARKYDELPGEAVGEVSPEPVTIRDHHLHPGQISSNGDPYLENGKYITLTVDITLPLEEIMQLVKAYIGLLSAKAGVTPHATRTRFYEAEEAFQVYDLRVAGKTDTEIARKLWPKKFKAATVSDEAARQRKYVVKSREYKAAGVKDPDGRAFKEAFRGPGFLYQRVADRDLSAKKRIEGLTQK
jgi:hypothetical protein